MTVITEPTVTCEGIALTVVIVIVDGVRPSVVMDVTAISVPGIS